MKRIVVLALALTFVLSLAGCSKSKSIESENKTTLIGVIEEINDNSMIVRCEQAEGYPQGELFSVSLSEESTTDTPKFLTGDQVIVTYNGDVAESDPMQINTVYSITTVRGAVIDTADPNLTAPSEYKDNDLDAAITSAILQYNHTELPDGVIDVESHIILANESVSGTPLVGETNHVEQVTVYLVYLNARYSIEKNGLEEHSSTANSAAITFTVNENGEYVLKEYWEARPGSHYSEDVNSKFPAEAANEALLGDGYSEKLIATCRAKATIIDDPNATVEKLSGKDIVVAQTNTNTLAYSDSQLSDAKFMIPKGKAVVVLQNIVGENVAEITYAGHNVWVDTRTLYLG